jgi:hypothetical protein
MLSLGFPESAMHTAAPTLAAVIGKDFPFESKKSAERNDVTLSRRIRLGGREEQSHFNYFVAASCRPWRPFVERLKEPLLHVAITKSGGAVEQALFRETSHIRDALKENITHKKGTRAPEPRERVDSLPVSPHSLADLIKSGQVLRKNLVVELGPLSADF